MSAVGYKLAIAIINIIIPFSSSWSPSLLLLCCCHRWCYLKLFHSVLCSLQLFFFFFASSFILFNRNYSYCSVVFLLGCIVCRIPLHCIYTLEIRYRMRCDFVSMILIMTMFTDTLIETSIHSESPLLIHPNILYAEMSFFHILTGYTFVSQHQFHSTWWINFCLFYAATGCCLCGRHRKFARHFSSSTIGMQSGSAITQKYTRLAHVHIVINSSYTGRCCVLQKHYNRHNRQKNGSRVLFNKTQTLPVHQYNTQW